MEQLTLIEPNQDIGDTTSNPILDCKNQPPPYAIVESQVPSSETISKDKSNLCEKNIQEQKSLKTLFVPSTISVVGLNPYWNEQCEANNSKLWLPIKTDSQDSDLSLSNGLSSKTVEKSWFSSKLIYPQSKNLQTICLASSMSWNVGGTGLGTTEAKSSKPWHPKKNRDLLQARIDCRWYVFNEAIKYLRSCVNFLPTTKEIRRDLLDDLPAWCDDVPLKIKTGAISEAIKEFKAVEANPMTRAKTIKLKPTAEQKQIFKKWNDCSRYVFNQTIDYIRSCVNFSPSWMDIKKDLLKQLPAWCNDTPFQIKAIAVKEAHQAYWKAKAHPKFRSRKNPTQSCYIPKSAIKKAGIYPRVSGKNLQYSEALPNEPLDGRLIYQYNEWFLSVPQKIETSQCALNQGRVVALDPGVRTFQTFFSEFAAGQIGYDDFGRIARLCFYLDDLISRTSKAKSKTKRRMKIAQARMRKKIKNLIKEIHFKTARFLVDNFDVILLPTFETSQLVGKKNRKLRSKTVRAMLTWSHYQFKVRLKNKALEFGKKVIDVCEAFTSKTVSWTGEVKKVGGSRVIEADGIKMDRDMNGARGIFLRSLVDSPALMAMLP
jgi:putative transposase